MRDIGLADLDGLSPVLSAVLLLWNSEQLLKPSYSMDLPVPRGTSMHLLANLIIFFILDFYMVRFAVSMLMRVLFAALKVSVLSRCQMFILLLEEW